MSTHNELITEIIYKPIIKEVVSKIKTIADSDKSNKTQVEKEATACFTLLGQNPNQVCEHGLQFFQCMPCSH